MIPSRPGNQTAPFAVLILIAAFSTLLFLSCAQKPPSTRIEPVTDTLHGVAITDNYRWLENGDSPEVQEWIDKQDKYCRDYIAKYPDRDKVKKRIEELMKIGYVDNPAMAGGKYFYMKREGDEEHPVLLMKRTFDAQPEIIINPNQFGNDITTAMDWWYLSSKGKFIAYGKSSQGSENSTLFIRDVDNNTDLADSILNARAASVAWLNDNSGFYYTRYPDSGTVPPGDERYYRKVFLHKIGEDYHKDPLVFGEGREKTEWCGVQLLDNGDYLLVPVYIGWSKSELYMKNLKKDKDFIRLTDTTEALYSVDMGKDYFYVLTNYQAPKFRVMRGTYKRPEMKYWKEMIPEGQFPIEQMAVVGDNIVVCRLENASSRLSIYSTDGKFRNDIRLPAIGSLITYYDHVLGYEHDGHELLFGYNSYFIPPRIYRYDFNNDSLTILDEIKTDLDLSEYTVEQVWYPSKDGTKISMFLVHRKNIKLDGNNPTIVYGYGGFASNEVPSFSRTRTMFLKRGGVYADTQLRGGSEYGEQWHRAGMLENKQNVFDDFIAACEWLIDNKYTNPDKLAIEGGSNGGLLVGAVMVQRPDLMKAVECWRPLLDMLRYHKFLIGELWIPEYGSADNPEQFKYLYAYSPYHHVKKGVAYPAVLFESADHDTRVDPLHARKMTAAMQAATSSDNPILFRVQRRTGHGQNVPKSITINELVDEWSFIFQQLGMRF
jgi:prolyl oligopeptidase